MGNKSSKFEGKVAVVTGASKGIGAEVARQFAKEGAAVVVNYSASAKAAESVVAEIEKFGGRAVAVQANLSKPEEVTELFEETKKRFGKVDILVNNAGIYDFKPLEEITPQHFHHQFNLNVLGLILATQEAAKAFGPNGGSVVNIGSVAGRSAIPGSTVYSATKAAVDSITRVLAAELGARKIRVNTVNPGMIETEGSVSAGFIASDFRKKIESETPLGRIGQVDDVAPVVLYLASEDAKWVTGEAIYVSGGNR